MTKDEQFILNLNIAHYEAMLKLDIDDEKHLVVEALIAKAEALLTPESSDPL
jgi:hypothetical protein